MQRASTATGVVRAAAFVGSAASLVMGGGLIACSTSSTATPYTPYTGIDVPTASIVAGIGCAGPESGPSEGIDHFAVVVTYASGAGSLADVPSTAYVAAGVFQCFVPAAVFENIDASGAFDVWIFAYAAGQPSTAPALMGCEAGTCPLPPTLSVAQFVQDLLSAQSMPGQQALRVVMCRAMAELGSHPSAYDCRVLESDAGLSDSAAGADGEGTVGADAGDAADGPLE